MKKHENNSLFDLVAISALILFIGFILLNPSDNSAYKNRDARSLEDFSTAWYTNDNRLISLKDIGEYSEVNADGDNEIVVNHKVPAYIVSDTYLNFLGRNIRFQVIIGNRVVQSFMPEHRFVLSKGNGSSFHKILIKREHAGQTLSLKIFPAYNSSSSYIDMVYLGRVSDYSGLIVDKNAVTLLLCVLMIAAGVVLIFMSFLGKIGGRYNNAQRVLGVAGICIGFWAAFETDVIQYLFGYSFQIHEIVYIILIFLPYYFASYVSQVLKIATGHVIKISFAVTMTIAFAMLALNVFGIMDFHESLFLIYTGFVINAILIIYAIAKNVAYNRKNKVKNFKFNQVFIVVFFIVCATADWINYYLASRAAVQGTFMRIGIFAALVMLVLDAGKNLFEDMKKAEITEIMTKLAYTDALTDMENRTAFEEKEAEIAEKIQSGELSEVLICQIDLNNLKKVNDSYGHACGDKYLIKSAEIIKETFGKSGFAYRIGGDEFIVFIISEGAEFIYEKCVLKMKALENEFNKLPDVPVPLHLAYGHSMYRKGNYESIEKAEIEADRRMYRFKEEIKKGESN